MKIELTVGKLLLATGAVAFLASAGLLGYALRKQRSIQLERNSKATYDLEGQRLPFPIGL